MSMVPSELGINTEHIISNKLDINPSNQIEIHLSDFPFQNKSLPELVIQTLFLDFKNSLEGNWTFLATDASKNISTTNIAAIDILRQISVAGQVPQVCSVFTSEALAIYIAIKSFIKAKQNYIILSDSFSVLNALSKIGPKSPSVIALINDLLISSSNEFNKIMFIWTPAHMGIYENELADAEAKNAPSHRVIELISIEDIFHRLRYNFCEKAAKKWSDCKYSNSFYYIKSTQKEHRFLPLNRAGDISLARFRTKSLPTKAKLYRMGLAPSPMCIPCNVEESTEHIILVCSRYENERFKLRQEIGCIPLYFPWLFDFSGYESYKAKAIIRFIEAIMKVF